MPRFTMTFIAAIAMVMLLLAGCAESPMGPTHDEISSLDQSSSAGDLGPDNGFADIGTRPDPPKKVSDNSTSRLVCQVAATPTSGSIPLDVQCSSLDRLPEVRRPTLTCGPSEMVQGAGNSAPPTAMSEKVGSPVG